MPMPAGGIVLAYLAFCAPCNLRRAVYLRSIFHNDKKMYYRAPQFFFLIVVATINLICLFCEVCLLVLGIPGEKTQVFMIT